MMKGKKFILIGDGYIAQIHKKTIHEMGGEIINIYDPEKYTGNGWYRPEDLFVFNSDYVVICSPSHFHRQHIIWALNKISEFGRIIVEKPMILPGEPFINDDRINVVMQYRWMPIHRPVKFIKVRFIRGDHYFDSWKGDHTKTGGFLFNLFIHYIDLAYIYKADFEGDVRSGGSGYRLIDGMDMTGYPRELLYQNMYESISRGYGVKPSDIWPLWNYLLHRVKVQGIDHLERDGCPFYFFHL